VGITPSEIGRGIQGIAYPFFERGTELSTAREALGDLPHYIKWSACLSGFNKDQALMAMKSTEMPLTSNNQI